MATLSHFPDRDQPSQRVADDRPIVVGDLILGLEPTNLPGGRPARVRYATIATEALLCSEMTRWASTGLAHDQIRLLAKELVHNIRR